MNIVQLNLVFKAKVASDMLYCGKSLVDKKHRKCCVPLLITHGNNDQITSFKASKTFYDLVPSTDKEFKEFDGLKHELHFECLEDRKVVIQFYIDWMIARSK